MFCVRLRLCTKLGESSSEYEAMFILHRGYFVAATRKMVRKLSEGNKFELALNCLNSYSPRVKFSDHSYVTACILCLFRKYQ